MFTPVYGTDGFKVIDVNIRKPVIGPGSPGAKSATLKRYQPLIEKTAETGMGLLCLPQVSITPGFMAGYLKRIGASHEKPEEARAAIGGCEFSSSEKEAFAEAISPFQGSYIAVRSDEGTAAGVGLWHTGFMAADSSPGGISIFEDIARRIMQSEFSLSVLAFKKRIGLPMEEPPGIFTTPIVGHRLGTLPPIFGPFFQANVITRFTQDDSLVSMGIGIGGANSEDAHTKLLNGFGRKTWMKTSTAALECAKAMYNGKLEEIGLIPGAMGHVGMIMGMACSEEAQEDTLGELKEGLRKLDALANRPLYLELALGGAKWAVVQCAEANLRKATKPDVPEYQKILRINGNRETVFGEFGVGIFGRGTVEASTVVYLSGRNVINDLPQMNKSLKEYVLIAPEIPLRGFGTNFNFEDYSNATAIIVNPQTLRSAQTHLNGAMREAGIIALAGNVDGKFLSGLTKGINERELLVYANDGTQEAFVATTD
jgi:hypothetical protein